MVNPIDQCQPRMTTLKEVREILDKEPCILFENYNFNQNNRRQKRFLGGNDDTRNHINAINAKIAQHHDMINVLTNSSINTTIMFNAIRDHHVFTMPNLYSWRDLSHLLVLTILLITILYFLFCQSQIKPCQKLLLLCLRKNSIMHSEQEHKLQECVQQQQQQLNRLEQQFEDFKKLLVNRKSNRRTRAIYPSMPSVNSDITQYNQGYMSE